VAATDERVSVASARAVEEKLDDVLDQLVRVADAAEEDGEAVRRLRVATRRAEAALRAFREVLPQRTATRVREVLRDVRSATNAARDADVLLARLAPIASEALGAVLRADRRAAQHEVRAVCRRLSGDAGFARRVASLTRKARSGHGDGDVAAIPFDAWAQARLAVAVRRFFGGDAPDLRDVEQLHDLRLRTKKLRYEIEILAAVSPPRLRTDAYPILTGLQDRLGDVNDGTVAVRRLEELACATSAPRGTPAFDALAREANDLLSRSRADLAAWWTPLRAEQLKSALV
jgi:CHAD domain-containing protein